jgi:hypothetical protein
MQSGILLPATFVFLWQVHSCLVIMQCSNCRHDTLLSLLSAHASCVSMLYRRRPVQTQPCFTFTPIRWVLTLSSWAASGS